MEGQGYRSTGCLKGSWETRIRRRRCVAKRVAELTKHGPDIGSVVMTT